MKKLLSIILALAMILTLVPSVFANGEAEADGITIEYSFLKADYVDAADTTAPHNYITYLTSGGRLEYDADNSTTTNKTISVWNSTKPYLICQKNGEYITFKIRVPKGGKYSAALLYNVTTSAASGIGSMYILPGDTVDVESALKTAEPVFENINFGGSSNATPTDNSGTFTADKAGEYYMVWQRTGENGNAMRPARLILTQGTTDTPALIYADVALGKTEIDAGVSEKTEITLSNVYMSDGVAATDAQKATITYTSSDENVAVIENGIVKAIGVGTAKIHAMDGEYSLGDAEIAVTDSRLSGVKVEYSFVKGDNGNVEQPEKITYLHNAGKMSYYKNTSSNETKTVWSTRQKVVYACFNAQAGQYHALKIRVPEAGLYNAKLEYSETAEKTDVYILPVNTDIEEAISAEDLSPNFAIPEAFVSSDETPLKSETASFDAKNAGEYLLVLVNSGTKSANIRPAKLTLDGGNTKTPLIFADVSLGKTTLEVTETTTLTKGTPYLSNGNEADATGVTYKSTNEAVATISDTAVTAVAPGTAKIQALRADGYVLDEEIVTVNTPEYTEAFGDDTFKTEINVNVDPSVVAVAYAKDATLSQTATAATKTKNGTWSIETPEEIDEYTFRYWARGLETGNKRIVSLKNNFTYSPEKGDANYLIAVYANNSEPQAKEYFNANGQFIPDATDETKPYMLGYGYATGWKDNGNGIKEAVYENGVQSYDITVNGTEKTYSFGTEIICPTVTPETGKYFLGWTKKVGEKAAELVSTDMNYTFYAWEDCTVEPLFGNSAPELGKMIARKILISSLAIENDDSVIMAEFIGFENAVERGITLGSKDYAMSNKNATQFTIINDVKAANISAYAILADGTKFIYNLK